MEDLRKIEFQPRLRTWLTICYTLFIVYGSLSPFSGWRDQGLNFLEVLQAPFHLTYTAFDAVINLLAYLPFGLLVGLTLRSRFAPVASVFLGLCIGATLSASMEYLQMYLPSRTSSNLDILNNSAGTLIGSLMAVSITSWTWLFSHLTRWRHDFFLQGKAVDFGLALLALWIFGQINPSLPMLGNVFITEVAHHPFVRLPSPRFDFWASIAVTLNVLMLGALMLTVLRARQKVVIAMLIVLAIVALAKFVAAALLLKSWALLLWISGEAVWGMALGLLLLVATFWLPRSMSLALGAVVAIAYFSIINFALDRRAPSAAMSIYHWHYGHLLNYNGLAQTIIMVFPALLLTHLWRIRKV